MCFHIPAHKSTTAGQVDGRPQPFAPGRAAYQRECGPDYPSASDLPHNERVCNAIGALDWRNGCPPQDLLNDCLGYCLDAVSSWPAGYATSRYETKLGSWWHPVLSRN